MIQVFHKAGAWAASLAVIFLLFSSSGCGISLRGELSVSAADMPEEILLEQVPFFPQQTYQCGPSSLAMLLVWTGLELTPEDLTADVYTPGLQGSLQSSLISAARQHGRIAYPIKGFQDLFTELNAGHPVIVLQNLGLFWYPKYHYAVVIGYENNGQTIILHSGEKAAKRISKRVFENTWARAGYWGLLILPPGTLPITANEGNYIRAVAGLERAEQFEAAIRSYKTALFRWPGSLSAWMGLGNSFFAQGDLSSAAKAFEQATIIHPTDGMPLNNLARVLWEQGKEEEALLAVRHAIELGGPFKSVFEETLHGFEQISN